ncbi:alpha/beta hydrolase-fold protein [Arthrobacter sp. AL08]|uniref:alpha/beta hydrolase n=1 Tax=unclassified Arthrobacter TaxID=235627 RepID=UPI00249B30A3|nr:MULTISPECIES: alpha/beta hydrolase-fold protein [unclassified Arthrobacter]MDI3242413.1 alpha/beta hydrolase-fold protein [Arthrobacter sp. AL05]MDI3278423.1 alpha/beta hydrolase-fold protein [Arthrobacter sp. AL08]
MDASELSRRRLLELAGIGVGASALAACAPGIPSPAAPPPAPPAGPAGGQANPTAGSTRTPAVPLTVRTRTGSFVSVFRPGISTGWSLAAPEAPPGAARPDLPLAVFLHGLGGSHTVLLEELAAHEALRRHLDAGGLPFGIAAVDGGNSWWHPRADGSDTQAMLIQEFIPFLGGQGYDLGRIGLFGLSMGGFGSLLLASQGRLPGVRAVAAMSPALWDHYDPRTDSAFDGPDDFAAHNVFALRPRLAALPKRIDCGTADTLAGTVRQYREGLPGAVEGGFQPGGHDSGYWRSILPEVLSFLGRNLA